MGLRQLIDDHSEFSILNIFQVKNDMMRLREVM